MKKIKLTEKDLNRIVKRVLNEGLFSRKKKIKSFQDYNDYINGINTTVTLYEKGDNFLVTRRGDYDEYVIKTFSKDDYSVEDVLNIVSDMTNEDKFRTEPEHFTHIEEANKRMLKEENMTLNERYHDDKELVKNELINTITSEMISTLEYTDRMGFDGTLNYDDLTEILEEVFRNTEYLFSE